LYDALVVTLAMLLRLVNCHFFIIIIIIIIICCDYLQAAEEEDMSEQYTDAPVFNCICGIRCKCEVSEDEQVNAAVSLFFFIVDFLLVVTN